MKRFILMIAFTLSFLASYSQSLILNGRTKEDLQEYMRFQSNQFYYNTESKQHYTTKDGKEFDIITIEYRSKKDHLPLIFEFIGNELCGTSKIPVLYEDRDFIIEKLNKEYVPFPDGQGWQTGYGFIYLEDQNDFFWVVWFGTKI